MDINFALEVLKKWCIVILFVATILLTAPKMFEYPVYRAHILESVHKD